MRSWLVIAIVALGCHREAPRVAWHRPTEIAVGGGTKGPWQQNNSRFDYVDDPSAVIDAQGAAAVVWVDQARKDIFFQIFEPDGRPRLASPINVSRTPDVFSWLPRTALSPLHPRDVYVLWQEIVFSGGTHGGDIFFARSQDGGTSFEPPLNLSHSREGDGKGRLDRLTWHNGSLDLAIGPDGTLYAAWTAYDGPLWFTRSRDRGESFSMPLVVDTGTDAPARAPTLAVSNDRIALAWTVGEDANADIRVAISHDGGETFGTPSIVERTPGRSDAPKLAASPNGTLHLVYAETAGAHLQIRYARSRDGGNGFERSRVISGSERAGFPSLAVDGANVYVIWETYPDPGSQPRGLGFTSSRDRGATFSRPAVVAGTRDRGTNGSHQGHLMRKLAVRDGVIVVVNSALRPGEGSRVWLVRGSAR